MLRAAKWLLIDIEQNSVPDIFPFLNLKNCMAQNLSDSSYQQQPSVPPKNWLVEAITCHTFLLFTIWYSRHCVRRASELKICVR